MSCGQYVVDPAKNPRRVAILAALNVHQVLSFRAMARQTGIAPGTLAHHLHVLSRHGLVAESFQRGLRLIRLPGLNAVEAERIHFLRQPGLAEVLAVVVRGPCFQRDLFTALPTMPRSTVQNRIGRLVQHALVRVIPQGRLLRYEIS